MPGDDHPDLERVREHLRSRPVDELVERVIHLALDDEAVWFGLVSEARIATGDVDIPDLKKQLTYALRIHGHLNWRQVPGYVQRVDAVLDLLRTFLDAGHPQHVIALAEHVVARLDTALGHMDDSGGHTIGPFDELAALHHAACVAARPEPRKLGTRLADIALKSEWEWFLDAPVEYADVLGEAGLAAYRARLDRDWNTLPPLTPGMDRWGGHERPSRHRITHLKESLARASGDVDELVRVLAHDLSSPYGYVRIAEELEAAGREREALVWLERGRTEFPPDGGDPRLRRMLVDAYLRDGQEDDALDVARTAFDAEPGARTYGELRHAAGHSAAWTELRAEALDRLRTPHPAGETRFREGGRSAAVRVQVDEGEVEAAWQDAVAGGCSDELWYRLAELRFREHPDDALGIYLRHLDAALARADVRNYEEAVRLLERIDDTLAHAGRPAEFTATLDRVRDDNRRRPKLIEMLDRRWPASV